MPFPAVAGDKRSVLGKTFITCFHATAISCGDLLQLWMLLGSLKPNHSVVGVSWGGVEIAFKHQNIPMKSASLELGQ